MAETGTFLSKDPWLGHPYLNQFISPTPIIPDYFKPQSLNQYAYAYNNSVNLTDPSGLTPNCESSKCKIELMSTTAGGIPGTGHFAIGYTDVTGNSRLIEAFPSNGFNSETLKKDILEGQGRGMGDPTIWYPLIHPYETTYGIIHFPHKDLNRPTLVQEYQNQWRPTVTVIAEGEEACGKWPCFYEAMKQIEKNEIGYMILGPNSNSGAISVLRKCQVPWWIAGLTTQIKSGRVHLAWELYLLDPIANTRSERKQYLEDIVNHLPPIPNPFY